MVNLPPYVYLIEMAETVECIAARLESCLASVMIHWKQIHKYEE